MPKPPRMPIKMVPQVLNSISARMQDLPSRKIGKFILELVKSPKRIEAFRANPESVLNASGISPEAINLKLLVKVVGSISRKILGPEVVTNTLSQKETSSYEKVNFDHSASWYWNKDGYNVMYDKGQSAEKTKGELVGKEKDFSKSGVNLPGLQAINEMLGKLFFPAQPLVTPELIEHIRQSAKEVK